MEYKSFFHLLRGLFFLILSCSLSCSSEEVLGEVIPPKVVPERTEERIYSEQEDSLGRLNAVKKARQMTDLEFTPLNSIDYNTGTFLAGETYKGLIYSSVKEIETYVGSNVSFYTFMTAINNPRSKIYTEKINKAPYHGKNCKAYYGTVCSGLVCYALGLNSPRLNSFDFPDSKLMELIEEKSPEELKLADVLWKKGHVALITDIIKDDDGIVSKLEISEAIGSRCKRYNVSRQKFISSTMKNFQRIYRYKRIGENTSYTTANDFVAVDGEQLLGFKYNTDLCVDKGDKSNYLEGEDVVINILNSQGIAVEIYRGDELMSYQELSGLVDIPLSGLTYGDYKARILKNSDNQQYSDFTYWKVVNAEVHYDRGSSRLYFHSNNATPDHVICCDISGTRPPLKEGYCHVFAENEIIKGFVNVPSDRLLSKYPYFEILLTTEFGNIICNPFKWM